MEIRPVDNQDLAALIALNNAAVPAVNRLDQDAFGRLLEQSCWHRLVRGRQGVLAFLIAFAPGSAYSSPNYRWFNARYDAFRYIDRVVVSPATRGLGIGSRLYRQLLDSVPAEPPHLVCEVNLEPPNPASLRFHHRLGFAEVGRQFTDGGAKEVALLSRPAGLPMLQASAL